MTPTASRLDHLGKAAALDRDDLDSESRELTITRQLIALPGELSYGPPKSRASCRTIALDEVGTHRLADQAIKQTVELLRHLSRPHRSKFSRPHEDRLGEVLSHPDRSLALGKGARPGREQDVPAPAGWGRSEIGPDPVGLLRLRQVEPEHFVETDEAAVSRRKC
jgi:hypothetical protein